MRKLAQVVLISDLVSIPEADAIELAKVLGWNVVVKKGDFCIGDKVIYFEIDSWIPHELAPFLSKGNSPRTYNGVLGERLKTIKLRGQVSQGLILPLGDLVDKDLCEGTDLTDDFNIQKWEPEIPACLSGQVKGNFPTHLVSKTDEVRIQGEPLLFSEFEGKLCYISTKMDGSSGTFILHDDDEHVCSRNLSLKEDENNSFWKMYRKYDLDKCIKDYCSRNDLHGLALQGEICGPGIQKNRMGLSELSLFIFNVFNIDSHRPFSYKELIDFCQFYNLLSVPIEDDNYLFSSPSLEDLLSLADGKYSNGGLKEGIVIRPLVPVYSPSLQSSLSVKVINNKYLLKNKDS